MPLGTISCRSMASASAKRELGRGEKVLPGLWRLRLPLPWPGIPHCNAWTLQQGDGLVMVDCGMHLEAEGGQPSSISQLERALAQVGQRLDQVQQLVITHAHSDHWGQAAPVIERSGAELWMHPNHRHGSEVERDRESMFSHRLEIARAGGVPERVLLSYAERIRDTPSGVAAVIAADQPLVNGTTIPSELGEWIVYETPGHAPSHVCLYQPERRILISGDHLLGRLSLYYDYGWSADPVAEYLSSLKIVEALDVRLCVSGHGRPFTDAHAHIVAARALVIERIDAALGALNSRPRTALELVPFVYGEQLTPETAGTRLTETLCLLTHLENRGQAVRESDGVTERFRKP